MQNKHVDISEQTSQKIYVTTKSNLYYWTIRICFRTSLYETHRGRKDWFPSFLARDLAFWFLVCFGKICTPISLNRVIIIYSNSCFYRLCLWIWLFPSNTTVGFGYLMVMTVHILHVNLFANFGQYVLEYVCNILFTWKQLLSWV